MLGGGTRDIQQEGATDQCPVAPAGGPPSCCETTHPCPGTPWYHFWNTTKVSTSEMHTSPRIYGAPNYTPRTAHPHYTPARITAHTLKSCLPPQLPAQEPKLVHVSGANISDATQVMQSTITPASEPRSSINEKRFGPEPKTVDQARRRGVPVPVGHPRHTLATP